MELILCLTYVDDWYLLLFNLLAIPVLRYSLLSSKYSCVHSALKSGSLYHCDKQSFNAAFSF